MADTGVRGAYRFGPFHLDVCERRLSRGCDVIPLRLKVFDTLLVLVEDAGRLVTKQEFLDTAPDLSEAIKAAFTSERRQNGFDGVNVDSLPKAAAEQGFEALEVLRS